MEREIFEVAEEEVGVLGQYPESWEIDGEVYEYVTSYGVPADGDANEVIVKRQSDGKLFMFFWEYYNREYFYEPEWQEVIKKEVVVTQYDWWDE